MPACLRTEAERVCGAYRVSQRRVCRVLRLSLSTCRYRSVKDKQAALRMRLKELAATRVHYGYRRLHILRQREGECEENSPTLPRRKA